jgi:hypothetical protein
MSLEYLEGYSNQGDTADVWILRDEEGKIIAFTMQIFTNVHSLLTHRDGNVVLYNHRKGTHQYRQTERNNTMKYYDLTNKELLNAYNASTEYDEAMCCEICTRVGMHTDYYYADGDNIDRVMEEAVEQLEACC